jgi:hypothetical protein
MEVRMPFSGDNFGIDIWRFAVGIEGEDGDSTNNVSIDVFDYNNTTGAISSNGDGRTDCVCGSMADCGPYHRGDIDQLRWYCDVPSRDIRSRNWRAEQFQGDYWSWGDSDIKSRDAIKPEPTDYAESDYHLSRALARWIVGDDSLARGADVGLQD